MLNNWRQKGLVRQILTRLVVVPLQGYDLGRKRDTHNKVACTLRLRPGGGGGRHRESIASELTPGWSENSKCTDHVDTMGLRGGTAAHMFLSACAREHMVPADVSGSGCMVGSGPRLLPLLRRWWDASLHFDQEVQRASSEEQPARLDGDGQYEPGLNTTPEKLGDLTDAFQRYLWDSLWVGQVVYCSLWAWSAGCACEERGGRAVGIAAVRYLGVSP